MTPELTLLAVNAVFLAFAYGAVYPRVVPKTLVRMAPYDLAISAAALVTGGLLYLGRGVPFSLLLLDVPWWAFLVATKVVMELPLIAWFRRRHGLTLGDDD